MRFSPCGRKAGARLVSAMLVFTLVAAACGDDGGDGDADSTTTTVADVTTDEATTTTTVPDGPVAPLTGLPIGDEDLLEQPAVMVKISNNDGRSLEALIGIELADVVIEERIEDRATRFATIFHTELPPLLGPVRSGRPTDIELLGSLNNPLFIFSGAFPSVLNDFVGFARDGGAELVVDDGSGVNLFRDDDFRRPDNLFVEPPAMLEKFGAEAGPAPAIFDFVDGDDQPAGAVDGSALTVTGRDTVSFVYDEDRGYVRVQDGVVHVTREPASIPLVADNLIVMETVYTPSSYDPRNPDAHTTGTGAVSVMIGGERWDGTWSRPTTQDSYTFADADGQAIPLDPGRTWLTLVPVNTYSFTADAETTALVLGDEG